MTFFVHRVRLTQYTSTRSYSGRIVYIVQRVQVTPTQISYISIIRTIHALIVNASRRVRWMHCTAHERRWEHRHNFDIFYVKSMHNKYTCRAPLIEYASRFKTFKCNVKLENLIEQNLRLRIPHAHFHPPIWFSNALSFFFTCCCTLQKKISKYTKIF